MRRKVNIYYAGFKHRVGGAFFHVVNIEKGLKELGYEVDVITLDRLPLLVRYIPHVLERIGNTFKFPFGFLWKQWITKVFYKIMFKNSSNIEIFEDKIKYFAAVYPTGRVAIKIPVEANLSIDVLPEVVAELALINFNMRVIKKQQEEAKPES